MAIAHQRGRKSKHDFWKIFFPDEIKWKSPRSKVDRSWRQMLRRKVNRRWVLRCSSSSLESSSWRSINRTTIDSCSGCTPMRHCKVQQEKEERKATKLSHQICDKASKLKILRPLGLSDYTFDIRGWRCCMLTQCNEFSGSINLTKNPDCNISGTKRSNSVKTTGIFFRNPEKILQNKSEEENPNTNSEN